MYKNSLKFILILLISATVFISCGSDDGGITPEPDPEINLIFPDGGESLELGVSYKITWDDNINENIDIEFYEEISGNMVKVFQFPNVPSNGEYQFVVPFNLNLNSDYIIKLVSVIDSTINDESEMYFGVINYIDDGDNSPVDAIEVTIPHRGDYAIYTSGDIDWYKIYLYSGQTYFFENSSGDDFNTNFYLYKRNFFTSLVSSDEDNGLGLQPYINYLATEDGYYFLRVGYFLNDSLTGKQNNTGYYALEISENISLLTPNGGEVFMQYSTYDITWEPGIPGNVILSLERDSELVQEIATVNGTDSTYSWTIPNSIDSGVKYKIRISKENDHNSMDESDNYFAISTIGVVGKWNIHGTWSKWDLIWDFFDDKTWINSEGTSGIWELKGNIINWEYPSGTYYRGVVESDSMNGFMNGGSGLVGTWDAQKIID